MTLQNSINAVTLNENRITSTTTINNIKFSYSNVSYPTANYFPLTVNYYDNYTYWNAPTDFSEVLGQTVRTNVKGLPTGSWVRVCEGSTAIKGNLSYSLYKTDHQSTPIRSRTTLYTGGYTQADTQVNFAGEVLQTLTKHKRLATDNEVVITENFTYSPQGSMLTHTHQVGNNPLEFLTVNQYDALGQLVQKEVGGTGMNPLQTVDYRYNIRGWLTDINDADTLGEDLFGFKITYNEPTQTSSTALFNGNISETHWKTTNDDLKRMYYYDYDGLNRLSNAHYINTDVANTLGNYDESLFYDKNGNIQALKRNGFEETPLYNLTIDNLKYFYDPNNKNQLKKVVDLSNSSEGFKDDSNGTEAGDTTDDYTYDAFGNMIMDENKRIESIQYNHLNLPVKITFKVTNLVVNYGNSTIEYLYDATGVKLKKTVNIKSATPTVAITEYLGGFQYTSKAGNNTSGLELQYIFTPEGYVNNTVIDNTNHYNYVYNYTDHLGNIRLSYTWDNDTQALTTLEEHQYYPFGLEHKYYNNTRKMFEIKETEVVKPDGSIGKIIMPKIVQVANSGYQYQYNGKEWQDELSLNVYDLGARMYMSDIARFGVTDPASEFSDFYSTYSFCYNDPINNIDDDGEMPGPVGFFIGALSNYIGQVGYNKFYLGLDFKQSFTYDINIASIAVSGVTGAFTGGIDSFKNILTSKVGQKVFKELIDYGIDALVNTMENAISNKIDTGEYSFWKSLTGGLIEAGIGNIIPFKYIEKFENKLLKKMNVNANKMNKFKKRMENDNHRSKSTQKRNNSKYEEAKKNYTNYRNAYDGVKTVYDAYKDGGTNALTDELFKKNTDVQKPKPKTSIEVGPLIEGKGLDDM